MRHAQEPVYHSPVGTLRTSEEGAIAAGEGRKAQTVDEDRRVDEAPKIIISAGPSVTAAPESVPIAAPAPAGPRRSATLPTAPERQGGLGLVIVLYVLAAAALGYAIYERYLT
jgi:hypothetical protein